MSQQMGVLPSELLKIRNGITAFYFDRACWTFGSSVQNDLDEVDSNTKNAKSIPSAKRMVLDKWIPAPQGAPVTGRFRDPAVKR